MKKAKIITLSFLALTSLCGMLASCGGGNSYNPDNFLINGTPENPYKIVKEPVTIKIFAPHSAGNPEYKTLTMFKHLEKVTNLKFDFTTVDTGGYANRRASIWQDKNYKPDLFLFNNPIAEQVQFAENNFPAFVPFNDATYKPNVGYEVGNLIDNFMPNYKKGMDENWGVDRSKEDATKVATLSDGKMYSTLSVQDVPRDLTYKMFINQTWIENLNNRYDLGLPNANEIETIEQYLTVLQAFKDYDANQNGDPNDEIPVTSKSLEFLQNMILGSYGYVEHGIEINADKTEFVYTPFTEGYRKYLTTMNEMWSKGLLHQNTFAIKTDAEMAKYGTKAQLGSFSSAAAYITVGYDLEDQYVTVGPLTSEFYKGPKIQKGFSTFKPDGACISQQSLYPREVARLIDIMYSDLGVQLISYGVEGENWTWDNDEHTSWTFHVPEDFDGTQEDYRATITPNVGSASALYWQNDFVSKMNDEILNKINEMSSNYMPYLKVPVPNEIKMTSVEYEQISKIKASLDTQYKYLESKYIRGEGGADPKDDASYNEFMTALEGYKAKDLVDLYNQALKRYNG